MNFSSRNTAPLAMSELGALHLTITPPRTRSRPAHQAPAKLLGRLRTFLELFYSRAGLPLPRFKKVRPEEVPQPYRTLLVHSMDLTPTLEAFHNQTLALNVLTRWRDGNSYMREVVLHLAGTGRTVGYGAIRIMFANLPPAAAAVVLEEHQPFGSILREHGIPHLSWPQAFFRAEPDRHMQRVLGLQESGALYGRRNVLLDGSRRLLAEVVELLAPVSCNDQERTNGARLLTTRRNRDFSRNKRS